MSMNYLDLLRASPQQQQVLRGNKQDNKSMSKNETKLFLFN